MTTEQLDMLTQEVMPVLTGYFELVNAVQLGEGKQQIRFLHGLVEYMLTNEVKAGIFLRSKFKSFTALIITKLHHYRTYDLVQENEDLMKAIDELELYLHALAVERGGRGVRRLRQTGPHTGIMIKRLNRVKVESIKYLHTYYLNYCKCTNAFRQQQAQEQEQERAQERAQEQWQKDYSGLALPSAFHAILRSSERLKRKREDESMRA
jgi:hypothetical protein